MALPTEAAGVRAETFLPPFAAPWPAKIFAEVTTACNFRCAMCVKQSGPGIPDFFMTGEIFERLVPAFPTLETLILNGIGEPLLHLGLEGFVKKARQNMPSRAVIGFQTNGALLSEERAEKLLAAGTDKISLSVDASDPALFRSMREGGEADDVNRAALALESARKKAGREDFLWGAEMVLTKETSSELPKVIEWLAQRGGKFLLVTHIMPYDGEALPLVAYDPNVDETLAIYRARKKEAAKQGIDLSRYCTAKWRLGPVPRRQEVVDFMEKVVSEISEKGLPQHMHNLAAHDDEEFSALQELFERSARLAEDLGVDLRLPALTPKAERRCDFVEEGSAFISAWGTVHPCYFLWHSYTSRADGRNRPVEAQSFGSLTDRPLLEIWNAPLFAAYRKEICDYGYPYCGNCSLAPCGYIERENFEQDCLGNRLYCGACPWCLGVLQCMR
ncbi:MAG: radical SAM/SPASM family putative metalloenzyme maturase [Aminivibrio sp.]|jgi:putative metalloenzyme radical SAM/SPASM domain maturase